MDRQETGRKGEAVAAKYYMDRGYTLMAHGYRTRLGELDLVLRKDSLIVICEVKTRKGRQLGRPMDAVDRKKQQRIVLAARQFLQQTGNNDAFVRFDVAEVTPTEGGWQVHCIPAAFEAN